MFLLLLSTLNAHADTPAALTEIDGLKLHWRLSKRPHHLENLDKTVRNETEFNELEIVVSAVEKPSADVTLCVSREHTSDAPLTRSVTVTSTTVAVAATPDTSGTPAPSTITTTTDTKNTTTGAECRVITTADWEKGKTLFDGTRWVSQGVSLRSVVVKGTTDADDAQDKVEELIKPDGTATTTAFSVKLSGGGLVRERLAAMTYDASVARFEFQLVTHPGMFLGAAVPCEDIQEQGLELPGVCERNPANAAVATQLAIAPAGVRVRWAPFNDATWLGFATDVSAGVFGASIEAANGTTVDDPSTSLGLQTTPGSIGLGLDFRVPLAKQTLNFALEGGVVMAPITDETIAFRPAFMLVTSIPIATLVAR